MDDEGLEGLTMRRLGERLDIKSASLYWHVRDKAELLNLIADQICGEIEAPTTGQGWRERLIELAIECRRVFRGHRDAALVMAGTIPIGPNRLRLAELGLATLSEGGFDPTVVARAGVMFTDFVTNFVIEEDRAESMVAAFEAEGVSIGDWFQSLPAEMYPTLASLGSQLADADSDGRFRFGLDLLLRGLPDPGH